MVFDQPVQMQLGQHLIELQLLPSKDLHAGIMMFLQTSKNTWVGV